MSRVELLTVEDRFLIEGRGVIVIPDFPVPNGWKNRAETIAVVTPEGQQYEAAAQFSMSHFKPIDPKVPIEKRWRIIVLLLDTKKEELPVGSKILVSQEAKDAILKKRQS
jgi:hypothetical protein